MTISQLLMAEVQAPLYIYHPDQHILKTQILYVQLLDKPVCAALKLCSKFKVTETDESEESETQKNNNKTNKQKCS